MTPALAKAAAAVAVAAAIALAVGLLSASGWTGYVVGAVLALSLWVMLFAGSWATPDRGRVEMRAYAGAAALAVVLGYVMVRVGDGSTAFWAVGFILAGSVVPVVRSAARS